MAELEVQRENRPGARWRKPLVAAVVAVLVLGGGLGLMFRLFAGPGSSNLTASPTFTAKRGNLDITVLEGGSVEALESQEIRSEVKGYQGTKILAIVEEGYRVTEEDVANKKILVELDSSELDDKLKNQLIQIESTAASLIEAQKSYEIQLNQNESDTQAAALEAKFARMDLEKYLGAELTQQILRETRILERLQEAENKVEAAISEPPETPAEPAAEPPTPLPTEHVEISPAAAGDAASTIPAVAVADASTTTPSETPPAAEGSAPAATAQASPPMAVQMDSAFSPRHDFVDFANYAKVSLLGDGEARQKLRELEDKLLVAREELSLAETELEATERLVAKEFETQRELENKRLTVEKHRISVAAAETAENLFERYEFPKEAEKLLSDYVEKLRKLQRTEKEAQSKLAQAEAKLRSAEARFEIESQQVKETKDQISKCKIAAERPGLVVYGGDEGWYREERIQEGATVRERQMIITIPDMTKMSVKVRIHESDIKKVAVGQKAIIRVDAFPDRKLSGEVIKVGVLPDAEQRWMNPDLKVYETSIRIDGVYDWLKPGMSAETEIMIDTVENIIYVPVQAVRASGKERICYVATPAGPRRQVVKTGAFTDKFIEIKEGINEGDKVYIVTPEGIDEPEEDHDDDTPDESEPEALDETAPDLTADSTDTVVTPAT